MKMKRQPCSVPPRLYKRPMSRAWWLGNRRLTLFMAREISSVFLALFTVSYLVQLWMLGSGRDSYDRFLDLLTSPGWVALHVVVMAFALIHAVTWIYVLPKGLPERMAGLRIPSVAMVVGGFVAWVGASLVVGLAILS